jgi:colanic acid biosynthesis protein WcaH
MNPAEADQRLSETIRFIEAQAPTPEKALPEEIFLFVSRLTPLVNVDLLIRDAQGRVLLTWRDDSLFGRGWHVPGGCIRLGESFADRISAVAASELGTSVAFAPNPLGIYETIDKGRPSRTHHISLLFDCRLDGDPKGQRECAGDSCQPGEWRWHSRCPVNILQSGYRSWFPSHQ